MREVTCEECNTVHTDSECPNALDHYVGQCPECDRDMTAREYSDEADKCVYCYADGVGHGAMAESKSEAIGWVEEIYPMLTEAQRIRALNTLLAYRHMMLLPYNREECPYPAGY